MHPGRPQRQPLQPQWAPQQPYGGNLSTKLSEFFPPQPPLVGSRFQDPTRGQTPPPTDYTPTDNTPTDVSPTDYTPTDNTPTDSTPDDYTPTDCTPTDYTPTDCTSTDCTSTDYTPIDCTSTDYTPIDCTTAWPFRILAFPSIFLAFWPFNGGRS